MIWLLTLAFGIGGSMLIALNFSNAFEREKATALSSHQMLLSALQIVDEAGADPEHKELASTLEQLNGQEWTGFAMLSLCGPDGEIIYFSGERNISTIVQLAPDDGMSRMTVIRGDDGGRYIRLTSAFKSGQDTLILDQCSSVSDVYTARGEQMRIYRRVFAAVVVLGGGLSWLLAYWLTRPLTALSRASRRFAAGDLEYRETVRSTDELGTLTADFNVMADKLAANIHELQDAAARQESFMGSFAHEMKNPMTSIIGYAELIRSLRRRSRTRRTISFPRASGWRACRSSCWTFWCSRKRPPSFSRAVRRSLSAARWSTCGACSRRRTSCCSAAARKGCACWSLIW